MPITISGDAELRRKLNALSEAARGRMLERALVSGALLIQNAAKRNAPYLTGNLRRSIHVGGHDDLNTDGGGIVQRTGQPVPEPEIGATDAAVYIGTDVEYAAELEVGRQDGSTRARPYLRPAADTTRGDVRSEVAAALRELINAAAR